MSWGLLPSLPLNVFISAMLLACLLNPIPAWTSFLSGDHITGTNEAALALDPTIRLQRLWLSYSRSSQGLSAAGDAWTLTFTCPLPPFPASAGESCVRVQLVWVFEGHVLFYLIFSGKFMSISKTGARTKSRYSGVVSDQPHKNPQPDLSSPSGQCFQPGNHILSCCNTSNTLQ